jgi:GT2 family glycosyltransferase
MPDVLISVIIASYNSGKTIADVLNSLVRQKTGYTYEIIVVDSSSDETPVMLKRDFPAIKTLTFNQRKFAGDARNHGIAASTGAIIAFTDADCLVPENWIDEIARAHQEDYPVIGGAVDNANPECAIGWAYYFTEFNHWLPHIPAGYTFEIPGCCFTMKRWVYEKYGPFIVGTYCSDSAFQWRLLQDGRKPYFNPRIKVYHRNPDSLRDLLGHEPFHGKCYANVRVTEQRLPVGRIFCYLIGSPILPFLLFTRILMKVTKNRSYVAKFMQSMPWVFCGTTAWSFGEFQGYCHQLKLKLTHSQRV